MRGLLLDELSLRAERSNLVPIRASWPARLLRRLRLLAMTGACQGSQREAAVDDVDRAGGEGGLVGGEIDRQRRHLLGGAEPAHRLALDKAAARRFGAARRQDALHRDALLERGGGDRARADRVAADALGDEIGGYRLGQPDHGGLGGAVGAA